MQIDAQGIENNLINFTIRNYKKIIKKKYQKTHFHSIERKFETKIYFGRMKQLLECKYFYPIPKIVSFFSRCFKSNDQPQGFSQI
jgi:hypothetical protein